MPIYILRYFGLSRDRLRKLLLQVVVEKGHAGKKDYGYYQQAADENQPGPFF
jgi:hypothetical protein